MSELEPSMQRQDNLPKVSIIVPVYNGEKIVAGCLEAIMRQDYRCVTDIIVVDDGSTDRTAEIAKTFSRVKYIFQNNAGPASARNAGAREAKGEILFFTDSDCRPQANWVSLMIPHFSSPKNGVVAGSYGIANTGSLLARCVHHEIMFRHHELMPTEPRVFGSYNFAIRKTLFDKIGGFNTAYRYPSGEDNDLSYKVIADGSKICFVRSALVDHIHPEQPGRYLREQYRHGFWRAKMYRTHPHMSRGDDYTFWKDMVEVPLSGIAFSLALGCLFYQSIFLIFIFYLIFFWVLELFYSFRMMRSFSEKIYFSVIMLLRSFYRSFGFMLGLFNEVFSAFSRHPERLLIVLYVPFS